MYTDIFGNQRMKINLHTHTSLSDGRRTPAEAAAIYKAAGYDAIAITDHWVFTPSGEIDGLRILSGGEYHVPSSDAASGVFHILAIGCTTAPQMARDSSAQTIADEIIRCGGMPILAHPNWSVNTPQQGLQLTNITVTEIYNSVSDAHESSRPYSGYFVDAVAAQGKHYSLVAADDVHFYDGTDTTKAWIMLECKQDASDTEILEAIRARKFYATQGPELLVWKEENLLRVRCSPVSRISLFSNIVINRGYCVKGENLTEHTYEIKPDETYLRVEVTDADGRCAWSNIIDL